MNKACYDIEINEYSNTLEDVKYLLEMAFENINLEEVRLLIEKKSISKRNLDAITRYIEDHDIKVLIEEI